MWYESSISSGMNELLNNLLKLQTLEFDEIVEPETENQIGELRAKISPPILAHYDRLLAQGRKAWPPSATRSAPAVTSKCRAPLC